VNSIVRSDRDFHSVLLIIVSSALALCAVAQAQPLRSPWDGLKITLTDAAYKCPQPPPFAILLHAEGYYTDAHHSIIDPAKQKATDEATEAPSHLGQWTGRAADAYLATGSRAAAQCVYSLLDAASKAKAWSGEMPTGQGNYEQHWMLSGTAVAYLKVRSSGAGTAEQNRAIQKWFGVLAGRVRNYTEKRRGDHKTDSDAWNNHLYWSGLAVAAAGIAGNNRSDFHWGIDAYKAGVSEIRPDGVLPREMARAGMALHYHLYSLAPLVMLAELGEANGIDLYAENHGAIHRLVKLCEAGLLNHEIFAKYTGVPQTMPPTISGNDIGWAVPYVKRFPDPQLSRWIAQASWLGNWQWGGLPPG
jgi:poly(beta-D-mannuronate) lyase